MRELLNVKYSKTYLYLFAVGTLIEYCMDILKFDIGATPIKITRMVLLVLFYASLIKKPSIYLIIFIITSFTDLLITSENKLSIIALSLLFLSRSIFLLNSYQIFKWGKMGKINFLYVFIVPILIGALFFRIYINNITFYNHQIIFLILALACEALLIIIIIKSLINFLNDPKEGNKELLIGTTIILFTDLIYSVQDLSTSFDENIVGISSILYSVGYYMIIISHKKILEEN